MDEKQKWPDIDVTKLPPFNPMFCMSFNQRHYIEQRMSIRKNAPRLFSWFPDLTAEEIAHGLRHYPQYFAEKFPPKKADGIRHYP